MGFLQEKLNKFDTHVWFENGNRLGSCFIGIVNLSHFVLYLIII